ncbi:hypothetical protein NP493_64g06009 [Ridgeia piscesae]|uniref:Uncharacterized protein n=1 Tax=Ridgeia piscesae TaxID=27915 RepID=A0AAD9PAF2_RIDPI|nr:hypothetical protein NP493_64g06009 [Ridgeia piscesae]
MATRLVVLLLCCVTFTHAVNIIRDKDGKPALEVRLDKNGVERYKDELTGATDYGDWHYMAAPIPVVKDITGAGRSQILVDPIGMQQVWKDQGGTGKKDVAFWRMVCPAGRACAAYMKTSSKSAGNTTWLPLWTNQGGMEKLEGSIWGVIPNQGLKNTGFWFGNTGHLTPPMDGKVYCLKQYETVDDEA